MVEAGVREAIAQAYIGLLASKEALPHLERALEIRRRIQGENDPDTLDAMSRLGALYLGQKRTTEAEALLKEVYESRLRVSGEGDRKTTTALFALINAYRGAGNNAAAESLLAKARAMWEKRTEGALRGASEEDMREVLTFGMELGIAYGSNHQTTALSVYNRVCDLSSRLLGKDDVVTVTAKAARAVLARAPKDSKNISDSLKAKLKELDNTVMGTLFQSFFRANALISGNQFDEAKSALNEGLIVAQRAGSDDLLADTLGATIRNTLGWLRLRRGKPAEAEAALREAAGVLGRVLPDTWEQFNNQSMLGAALEAQKKFAEAEPLLVSGYQGMSSRKPGTGAGRFTLDQAGEAVVKLYQDWGKPEKASEWETTLAAAAPAKPVSN